MIYPMFTQRIDKLYNAFDKKKNDNQSMLLFDKVKNWSEHKLSIVVNKIIESENSFPSIAKFLAVGMTVHEEKLIEKTRCDKCKADGFVLAYDGKYRSLFRCDMCENWLHRLSDKIPVWSNGYCGVYTIEGEDPLVLSGEEVDVI